jgi:hypothetical protein
MMIDPRVEGIDNLLETNLCRLGSINVEMMYGV